MVEHVGSEESVSGVSMLNCGVLLLTIVFLSLAYVSIHDPQDYDYY